MSPSKHHLEDSDKESSNAKRHNAGAQEHQNENGKKRASEDSVQPPGLSRDRFADIPDRSQHDQKLKADEPTASSASIASKKRSRQDDTDLPNAKRSTPDPANKSSKPVLNLGNRRKLHTKIRRCETLKDCMNVLDSLVRTDMVPIACALNDAKEEHRLMLVKKMGKNYLSEIADVLIKIRMDKDHHDPKSLFAPIALKKYLVTLPDRSEQVCNICKDDFEEFQDMIPKPCGKHSFHTECVKDQLNRQLSPFFALCDCH
jgi:hypothetical protein